MAMMLVQTTGDRLSRSYAPAAERGPTPLAQHPNKKRGHDEQAKN